MRARLAILAAAAAATTACGGAQAPGAAAPYAWVLPAGFPEPEVPADNPMSAAKVELGRRLFYDRRLSGNQTQSCATCHLQALAFTDGQARGLGSTGERHARSPQPLANVGYLGAYTWANSVIPSLEVQALGPLVSQDPVELGASGLDEAVAARLASDPAYLPLFEEAFPEARPPITYATIVMAIAAFERTLVSGDSPYDRHRRGDAAALTSGARRGLELFFSDRVGCGRCHGGLSLTDAAGSPDQPANPSPFHNVGLYDEDGGGAYPAGGTGLAALTGDPADMGRFRTPSLRNVAVTAPYMHDGTVVTLSEVVDHFAAGGRVRQRTGLPSPIQSPWVRPFDLSVEEKADLLQFLEALTDEGFLGDPRFSDPFAAPP